MIIASNTRMLTILLMGFSRKARGNINLILTCRLTNSTAPPGSNLIPRIRVLLQITGHIRRLDNEVFRSFKFNLRNDGKHGFVRKGWRNVDGLCKYEKI